MAYRRHLRCSSSNGWGLKRGDRHVVVPALRVTLLLFPRDDGRFAARVASLTVLADSQGVRTLEERLRDYYPRAVVRQRDPLGAVDPTTETWYVYRDGSAAVAPA